VSSRKVEPALLVVLSESELSWDPLHHSMAGFALPTLEDSFVGIQVTGSAHIVRGSGKAFPASCVPKTSSTPRGLAPLEWHDSQGARSWAPSKGKAVAA